jgi:uncharacterized membrane protein YkgB
MHLVLTLMILPWVCIATGCFPAESTVKLSASFEISQGQQFLQDREGYMDTSADELIALSYRSLRAQLKLETLGAWIMRYGLVVVFLLTGSLKFTAAEASGIQPLVVHSPLMSWMYAVLTVQGVSNLIGVIEIAIAILLALRPISARLSFVGSVGSVVTFLLTTSFLLSTPGAVQLSHGLPVLTDAGQFLLRM